MKGLLIADLHQHSLQLPNAWLEMPNVQSAVIWTGPTHPEHTDEQRVEECGLHCHHLRFLLTIVISLVSVLALLPDDYH